MFADVGRPKIGPSDDHLAPLMPDHGPRRAIGTGFQEQRGCEAERIFAVRYWLSCRLPFNGLQCIRAVAYGCDLLAHSEGDQDNIIIEADHFTARGRMSDRRTRVNRALRGLVSFAPRFRFGRIF